MKKKVGITCNLTIQKWSLLVPWSLSSSFPLPI